MKTYIVTYRNRLYPFEGDRKLAVLADSKKEVRQSWHSIIGTDEYRIVKVDESKR